jgi:hypothetical protein
MNVPTILSAQCDGACLYPWPGPFKMTRPEPAKNFDISRAEDMGVTWSATVLMKRMGARGRVKVKPEKDWLGGGGVGLMSPIKLRTGEQTLSKGKTNADLPVRRRVIICKVRRRLCKLLSRSFPLLVRLEGIAPRDIDRRDDIQPVVALGSFRSVALAQR